MPALAPYHVEAYNTAKVSENKIHDDEVAQEIWFWRRAGARGRCLRVYDASAGRALGPRLARARRRRMPVREAGLRWRPGHRDRDARPMACLDIRLECRGVVCATGDRFAAGRRRRRRLDRISSRSPSAQPGRRRRNLARGRHLARHRAARGDARNSSRNTSAMCAKPRRSTKRRGCFTRSSCCICAISR